MCGAKGSLGQRPNVPEAGVKEIRIITKTIYERSYELEAYR